MPATSCLALFLLCALASPLPLRAQNCPPTAIAPLSAPSATVLVSNAGDFWFDGNDGAATVRAQRPNGDSITFTTAFVGALWLSATLPDGSLRVVAPEYGRGFGEYSYAPGPLSSEGLPQADCADWDRLFPLTRGEVDAVMAAYTGLPLDPTTVPERVLGWPGRGNPYFRQVNGFDLPDRAAALAPFRDRDGDGVYEPTRGDYPLVRGDRAVWTVFNSAVQNRFSPPGAFLPAEVVLLAYTYDAPTDPALATTTFYQYTITNGGDQPWTNFRPGFFLNFDLGCFENDRIGTIPDEGLLHVHNREAEENADCSAGLESSLDTRPLTFYQLVRATGPAPAATTTARFTSTIATLDGLFDGGPAATPPATATEVDRYLSGRWRDGQPIARGRYGYDTVGDTTRYIFDGGPTPDGVAWTSCEYDLTSVFDWRLITAVGPYTVPPGHGVSLTVAAGTLFNVDRTDNCPELDRLITTAGRLRTVDSLTVVSLPGEVAAPAAPVVVFPNPAGDLLYVRLPAGERLRSATLFGPQGRRLRTTTTTSLGLTGLPPGFYLLRVRTVAGQRVLRRIVVR